MQSAKNSIRLKKMDCCKIGLARLFYLAKECAPEELEFSQETIVLAFLSDIREKTVFKLGQKIVEKQTIQN